LPTCYAVGRFRPLRPVSLEAICGIGMVIDEDSLLADGRITQRMFGGWVENPSSGEGERMSQRPRRVSETGGPIQHVIIIVKENHTFDNYFGTFPGANGVILTQAPDPTTDPPHNHEAWLRRNDPGGAVRVQYKKGDIPAYWAYAQEYTLCDNYFTDVASQSEPNHLMLIAAASPVIDNATPRRTYQAQPPYRLPSLPAALAQAGRDWRDYADTNASYFRHIAGLAGDPSNVPSTQFDRDVARGYLPAVSWVYAPDGLSEHPPFAAGSGPVVRPGMEWTVGIVSKVAASPLWARTVIFITWDDWGGWYDHVEPPNVAQWSRGGPPGVTYTGTQFRYGPRVPCLVVSPYARKGVNSTFHSHVSLVKFCLRIFNVPSFGALDAAPNDKSDDMWDCFDFSATPRLNPPSPIPA
jgi:phospholipase C